jgi:transmembrane sensor
MDNTDDYTDLIIRYLMGTTSRQERLLLKRWIMTSQENKAFFISFRDVWLSTGQIDPGILSIDLTGKTVSTVKVPVYKHFIRRTSLVAAILAVVILTGSFVFLYLYNRQSYLQSGRLINIEVTMGSKAITTLPDGSRVWLNAGSRLSYRDNFGKQNRDVYLTGEAYFDVFHNPSKPFVVKAGNLSIKALGTAFNVKAYPDDPAIITTLVRGKVIIVGKDKHRKDFEISMKPRESVSCYVNKGVSGNKNRFIKSSNTGTNEDVSAGDSQSATIKAVNIDTSREEHVNTALFTSWKDAGWQIERRPLVSLVNDLERRYNIHIKILSEDIGCYRFTGTLQNETIEQLLMILNNAIPLKYTIDKDVVYISGDADRIQEFKKKSATMLKKTNTN